MYRTYKLTWVMDTGDEADLGWTTVRDEAEAHGEAVKRAHLQIHFRDLPKGRAVAEHKAPSLKKQQIETYLKAAFEALDNCFYMLEKWRDNAPGDPPIERRCLEDYGCLLRERRLEDNLYIALTELNSAFKMVRGREEGFEDL